VQIEDDGLIDLMRVAGIPITRKNHLGLAYMREVPADSARRKRLIFLRSAMTEMLTRTMRQGNALPAS
jgi:hypothetical protein